MYEHSSLGKCEKRNVQTVWHKYMMKPNSIGLFLEENHKFYLGMIAVTNFDIFMDSKKL